MEDKSQSIRFVYIDILKIIGICLVLNSHLDSIYPVAQLATGGALGNALFFICAGFCFQSKGKKFTGWFLKKLVRLYVPVYIITLVTTWPHPVTSVSQAVTTYIWPTGYWFIGAIVLFYLLLYVLEKYDFEKKMGICFLFLLLLYAVYYIFLLDTSSYVIEANGLQSIDGCFKLIYYFGIMLLGKYMRQCKLDKIKGSKRHLIIATSSVLIFYLIKILERKSLLFMHFQFAEHIFVILFAVSLLSYCINSTWLNTIQSKKTTWLIRKLSSVSLNVYLVQFAVIGFCSKQFSFPLSWFAIVVITFIGAFLLQMVSSWILKGANWCFQKIMAQEA